MLVGLPALTIVVFSFIMAKVLLLGMALRLCAYSMIVPSYTKCSKISIIRQQFHVRISIQNTKK